MVFSTWSRLRRLRLIGSIAACGLAAGCATAPVTHRLAPNAARLAPPAPAVWIAPIDAQLSELTAGGLLEPRDDWTELARSYLQQRLQRNPGFAVHVVERESSPELLQEIEDVQAVLRAMSLNRVYATAPIVIGPPIDPNRPFDYETGALEQHAAFGGHKGVLFLFVRDSYATAGRKALMALSVVGAAFTGVYIQPAMGSTLATAALVDHDGRVLWMNHDFGSYDLRTESGVNALLDRLLKNLPLSSATADA